jgi:hypothetical protein
LRLLPKKTVEHVSIDSFDILGSIPKMVSSCRLIGLQATRSRGSITTPK